jgi:hypothetical protein
MENRIKECQFDLYADRTSTATMRANQLRRCCAILEEYLSDRGGGLGVDFAEGFFFQSGDAVLELTVLHAAELRFDELTCALSEAKSRFRSCFRSALQPAVISNGQVVNDTGMAPSMLVRLSHAALPRSPFDELRSAAVTQR